MTFARYPWDWLPVLFVFGVLPTIVVPFVGIFFAFLWVVALTVAAVVAVVATALDIVAALRARSGRTA